MIENKFEKSLEIFVLWKTLTSKKYIQIRNQIIGKYKVWLFYFQQLYAIILC